MSCRVVSCRGVPWRGHGAASSPRSVVSTGVVSGRCYAAAFAPAPSGLSCRAVSRRSFRAVLCRARFAFSHHTCPAVFRRPIVVRGAAGAFVRSATRRSGQMVWRPTACCATHTVMLCPGARPPPAACRVVATANVDRVIVSCYVVCRAGSSSRLVLSCLVAPRGGVPLVSRRVVQRRRAVQRHRVVPRLRLIATVLCHIVAIVLRPARRLCRPFAHPIPLCDALGSVVVPSRCRVIMSCRVTAPMRVRGGPLAGVPQGLPTLKCNC